MNNSLDMLKSIKNPDNFDFLRSYDHKLLMQTSNRKRRFENSDQSPTDASNSSFESSSHLTLSPSLNDSSGNSSSQNVNSNLFLNNNQNLNYFDSNYFSQRYSSTNNSSSTNFISSLEQRDSNSYHLINDQFNQQGSNNNYPNNFDTMIKAFSSTYNLNNSLNGSSGAVNNGPVPNTSSQNPEATEGYQQQAQRSNNYTGYHNQNNWNFDETNFLNDSYQCDSFAKHHSNPYSTNENFSNYILPKISSSNTNSSTTGNNISINNDSNNPYIEISTNNNGQSNNSKLISGNAEINNSSTVGSTSSGVMSNLICDTSMVGEIDYNPRELEAFAERFKQRRIKLGVTQADVGKALGNLKLAGVGSLSQSTICRFESLTLSHNNMVALKPILQAWLEEAEMDANAKLKAADMYDSDDEKKRKRTSITDSEKRSLEAFFGIQPRPSSEKISQIADKLNLKKNVVRVWFCNQRQKQKRMKFSTLGILGHYSPVI